ncbi:tyrosine-type recombinase/integrase [Nonomuraea sp. 3-1Str]|uniref:tyrosine-type recombinase/integrase n=1 Tax=Nonomuraea sp. 3-1Str TaxID=2929801 RepID=UPI002861F436|nr:tyrosine-type recombinase/integrase [Nonomuraea sp. 3-1Str]MDR8413073.1 tyrosine-type recombinase/integrase [Nonomuraea sp. 3-1Str]
MHKVRPNTLARYRACLRLYFPPPLLKKKLRQLTAKEIGLWLDQLRVTCRCCSLGRCCQRYLSPLTIQYIHALLRTALDHAVREDDLARNVVRNVQVLVGRQQRFEPFTPAEARTFLNAVQDFRLHALFDLALRTGMRRGELLGLRWSDLNLTSGTLTIRQALQYVPGTGLIISPTKTPAPNARSPCPVRPSPP